MKIILSLLICIGFLISANAQHSQFKLSKEELRIEQMPSKTERQQLRKQVAPMPDIPTPDRNVDIVDIIDIGTAPNAFGYVPNLSYIWANPVLNTISNIHNIGSGIGYDISTDGGITWNNNIMVYENEGEDFIRYINQGIFNPDNNTNPDDAYISFCAMSGSVDPIQYGFLYGVGNIGDTLIRADSLLPDDPRYYHSKPMGFDLTSEGNIFVIDANTDWSSGEADYLDSLIIIKGSWDESSEDFVYGRENMEALVVDSLGAPVDYKIAFGPDGQRGYIVMLADNGQAEQVEGFKNLYPIYWKTTDAGETWEGPEVVQLDGPNGLDNIVYNLLTDSQIEDLFGPPVPSRENISYTTAYDFDIVVDKDDNLHIAVVIGPTGSDPYSIITASGYFAAFNLITPDGGESWFSLEMGRLRTFRGYFGDISSDNRIQITLNPDGDKSFTSWLDTDLEEEVENNRPNIWCRGYDIIWDCKTTNDIGEYGPSNVTNFSEGMWQAYFASAPKTSFEFEEGEYIIPYVFTEMDPNDPLTEVQFKYIQDFSFNETDFCPEGFVDLTLDNTSLKVIGNYPNPFKNETNIQIELYKAEDVEVMVTSITGQCLIEKNFGKLSQGQHELHLTLNELNPGICFYTVTAGNKRVTRKMIVE